MRIRKALDYINELRSKDSTTLHRLGDLLHQQYLDWVGSLSLEGLQGFLSQIQENKDKIGATQFFGKFRAFSFEEYVFRLIKDRVKIPNELEVFWGERNRVCEYGDKVYTMEVDISIGRKLNNHIILPLIVIDCKVELDSARLKTSIASFVMLRRFNPRVKCLLVYMWRDIDTTLLDLGRHWIDGIYQFHVKNDESDRFVLTLRTFFLGGV